MSLYLRELRMQSHKKIAVNSCVVTEHVNAEEQKADVIVAVESITKGTLTAVTRE